MTKEQAEELIDDFWKRHGMTDNSESDGLREELVAMLLNAYEQGKADK